MATDLQIMDLQIILFEVGGVSCALRRHEIQELLPLPRLWRPPGLPRPVAGFFNLAGAAIPVVSLSALFGLEAKKEKGEDRIYRHLILIRRPGEKQPTAFMVDRVLNLVSLPADQMSMVSPSDTLNGCVEAEIAVDGALVHLLSLDRVLFEEEQESLRALNVQAQKRLGEWATG